MRQWQEAENAAAAATRRAAHAHAHAQGQGQASAGPWDQVRAWPALRGEPKLAWFALWSLADGRLGATLVVTAAAVGADQGTSDRGGLRALEALAAHGLVHVIDRYRGRWTIELRDPSEVARARRRITDDPQARLPLGDELAGDDADESIVDDQGPQSRRCLAGDEPALAEQEVPLGPRVFSLRAAGLPAPRPASAAAEVALQPPRETLDCLKRDSLSTFDLRPSLDTRESLTAREPVRGGSGADTADDPATGPQPLGLSLASGGLARLLDPAARAAAEEQEAARVAGWIESEVRDRRLRRVVVLRVARAVAQRRFSQAELRRIFESMADLRREGRLRTPWLYFFGAARRRFGELGIDWPKGGA